jgi:hypothetical protein
MSMITPQVELMEQWHYRKITIGVLVVALVVTSWRGTQKARELCNVELEIHYDFRPDAWYWTITGEERVGDLGTQRGLDKSMGWQGPFLSALKAVQSAEHIHPDLKWQPGVLEHYATYLNKPRFQAGDK